MNTHAGRDCSRKRLQSAAIFSLPLLMFCCLGNPAAQARSIYAPWDNSPQQGFQSLVYGSSSSVDVQRVMGSPDEVVHSEQMFPVVENFYYYDETGSGAATVMVFQNGLLVGMHYKSPGNQLVDMTWFLTNNGDRVLNSPLSAGYMPYYPQFPFYQWQ